MDTGGYMDNTTQTIIVINYPVASFVYSPSPAIKNGTVTFDASASQPKGGVITIYNWDFGDATTVNTTNPVTYHVYTAVGYYNVTLTVTNSAGLSNGTMRTVRVADYPTAQFTWSPSSPTARQQVTFDASSSQANSGTIVGYAWNFGDGSATYTSGSPTATHAYSSPKGYNVTLTVNNNDGLSSSTTETITVSDAPPVASFICTPGTPIAGQPATLDASGSYDPDGFIINYTWYFGDGNVSSTSNSTITHTYGTFGNYTVTLYVKDNASLTTSTNNTLKVIMFPTPEFVWSPSTPQSSKPVTFNASTSQGNSGVIVTYAWNFGDGNVTAATNPIITHVYGFYGNYTVTLNVTNVDGLSAVTSQTLNVAGCPPDANFVWQPAYPLVNQTVTFDGSSSISNGGTIILYEWQFGDGSPVQLITLEPTVTHQYLAYGNYTVTLNVTNTEKLSSAISKIVIVVGPPVASFTWSPRVPQTYENVALNASTSMPNGGSIISFAWNFGDGNITAATGPIMTHVYTIAGNYTVTLNVTNSGGLWGATTNILNVQSSPPPIADFAYSPYPSYVNETIIFDASTSTGGVGTITGYTWNFGDGNVTTLNVTTVIHAFSTAGNYTVVLTIQTNIGLNSTSSELVTVLPISGPTAHFGWSPPLPAYNQTVTFDATASSPGWNGTMSPPIIEYVWNFGDGGSMNTTNSIVNHAFSQPGNYTVTLTVLDAAGLTNSTSYIVQVQNSQIVQSGGGGGGRMPCMS
jgi:PKD repeat protein